MDIDDQQAAVRDLIRQMMEKTGLDATGLARAAGIAPSTLSRFLYQPVKHLLTARTLAKLSEVSGIPVPVGSPLTDARERALLAGFRSIDEQGRAMVERLVRSLQQDAQPDQEPPASPAAHQPRTQPPPFREPGGREENPDRVRRRPKTSESAEIAHRNMPPGCHGRPWPGHPRRAGA
jgi:transcriptional regulator with XRE-family HTH domain